MFFLHTKSLKYSGFFSVISVYISLYGYTVPLVDILAVPFLGCIINSLAVDNLVYACGRIRCLLLKTYLK